MKSYVSFVINKKRFVRVFIIILTLSSIYNVYTSIPDEADHIKRKHIIVSDVGRPKTTSSNLTSVRVLKVVTEKPTSTFRYTTYRTPKPVLQTSAFRYRPASLSNVSNPLYRNISNYFHLSRSDHRDPLLNLHQFKYLINADMCEQNLFVLAFVHSSPNNVKERNEIRSTWGGDKRAHCRTVFLLGDPQNDQIQLAITEEARKYKDIVQGDFKDSYRNLTYKHIMGLSWTTRNCPNVRYILKTDDDTMVNVFNMMEYLSKANPLKNFLYCMVFPKSRPFRSINKWRVNFTEYPFSFYPSYCAGFAYLMTPDVAVQFLKVSKYVKFYWIDDVFITGILNIVAQVPFTSLAKTHGYSTMLNVHSGVTVKNLMFIVVKDPPGRKFWYSTWQAISKYG